MVVLVAWFCPGPVGIESARKTRSDDFGGNWTGWDAGLSCLRSWVLLKESWGAVESVMSLHGKVIAQERRHGLGSLVFTVPIAWR